MYESIRNDLHDIIEQDQKMNGRRNMDKADIGLIGLAVMGQNLVLNMADHGFSVAVFNRSLTTVDDFVAGSAKG